MKVVAPSRRRLLAVLAAPVVAVLVLPTCQPSRAPRAPVASPEAPHGSPPVTARTATSAVTGMCEVKRQARTDVSSAAATFDDRAHAELHAVAAAVQDADPAAAGRLLEAKQRLEAALAQRKAPQIVVRDADLVLAATIDALAALGILIRSCPP